MSMRLMRPSQAVRLAAVMFACGLALPPLSRAQGPGAASGGAAPPAAGGAAEGPLRPATPAVVALKAARLFDGRSDHWVRDGVVVVAGGKIQAVGAGVAVPAGAQVIDLGDVTLMPGL